MIEDRDDMGEPRSRQRSARRVFVRDLELMASVGIFEVEKRYQQRIVVSVELEVIDDYDGKSDRLDAVVDYGRVVTAIRSIVDGGHFHLIETLAERIAEACLEDSRVLVAGISIEKPDILPGCRSVGMAIERRRGL
ncbi:MAG: dihydroneopterin aldolase [Hyphomicrobiaceae bacterium]